MQTTRPHDDPYYDPPPPLEQVGVAPSWRLVAIVALLGVTLLLFVVVMLLIVLAHAGTPTLSPAVPLPPMVVAGGGAAAGLDPDPDDLPPGGLPYPDKQDLRPAGTFPAPGEDADARPAAAPRGEFLRGGQSVWVSPDPTPPGRVVVSPDGLFLAYHNGDSLMAGPPGGVIPVRDEDALDNEVAANGPGGMRGFGGGWAVAPAAGAAPHRVREPRPLVGGWSGDGVHVYWSSGGRVFSYNAKQGRAFRTPLRGQEVAPAGLMGQYVAVRPRPRLKVDGATGKAAHDAVEVVLLDNNGAPLRTLLTDDVAAWRSPAASADGKQLALISDRGAAAGKPERWRVFVFDLEAEKAQPRPVSPAVERVDSASWAPDGKTLVYARGQSPAPPDHRGAASGEFAACDLFEYDLAAGKETRLSRGGGFSSPTLTGTDEIYFVVDTPQAGGGALAQLVRMPLKAAREFLAGEAEGKEKAVASWKALAARADGVALTPEALRKLDEAFRKEYADRFKADAPSTAAGLDALRHEVLALGLPSDDLKRLERLLGAVDGEYLRRRADGGDWHLGKGEPTGAAVAGENVFGYAYNPFRPLKREAAPSLAEVAFRAAGRALVLSNDPALAKDALAKLGDADLERLGQLLKQGKGDDADKLAGELTKRHERNFVLLLQVGELLYRHGRQEALREAMQKPASLPPDPRLYNLLGVALLPTDNAGAQRAFQDALRCDLSYGPAYLNLGQAYNDVGLGQNARLCLRRYLRLAPKGEYAEDARRRLAGLTDDVAAAGAAGAAAGAPPGPAAGPAGARQAQ